MFEVYLTRHQKLHPSSNLKAVANQILYREWSLPKIIHCNWGKKISEKPKCIVQEFQSENRKSGRQFNKKAVRPLWAIAKKSLSASEHVAMLLCRHLIFNGI